MFLNTFWLTLVELAPWLFLGAAISAILHKTLPSGLIAQELKGAGGVFKAVALGIPLPLCSCGVIPAGIGLKKDGASDSSAIGFLISTPQTGVDSILVSAAMLGWPFAVFKMVSSGVMGIAGGLLVEYVNSPSPADDSTQSTSSDKTNPSWSDACEHGVQLIRGIWRWLFLGALLSAAIQTAIPTDWLGGISGLWAPLLALAISIPLYVCTTGSVPIAASLVAGGFPLGSALIFLMAGPATNIATIGAVRKSFGTVNTGIYLATVVLSSLVLGLSFDFILSDSSSVAHHHDEHHIISSISAFVLFLSFVFFAYEEALQYFNKPKTNDSSLELPIAGLTCNGCVSKLNRHLSKHPSISNVQVTLSPPKAQLNATVSKQEIIGIIQDAGFSVPLEHSAHAE